MATLNITDDLAARVAASARVQGHSMEDLAKEALIARLEYEQWFSVEVEKGLVDLAAGRVLTEGEWRPLHEARIVRLLERTRRA